MAPKRTRNAVTSTADTKEEKSERSTRRKISENGSAKGQSTSPTKQTKQAANTKSGDSGTPKKGKKAEVEEPTSDKSASTAKETKSPKKGKKEQVDEGEEQNDEVESLSAPEPKSSSRIASWNIISLKSSMGKGLIRYIEAEDADVVFLSETKCNDVPMIFKERYPHQTWGIGKTKGYAGVALLSKLKPIKVATGLPNGDQDTKARLITAEFENHILCGTYVVNAGEKLKSMPAKVQWNEKFAAHLAECDKRKPTIWTGDLNVVLDPRDLSKASEKWNKSAGYTATECNHHRRVLAGTAVPGAKPYVDIWRERNPDAIGHFTYFGFRGQCRQKGIGWRLDSFIIPERMKDSVLDVGIRHTVYGASDHLPIYMDIKGAL
ncbi:hypothetical protein L7F22_019717 [Adiantum nelumboides]|nr:hypothetical protein [Adiantum nelumboides]